MTKVRIYTEKVKDAVKSVVRILSTHNKQIVGVPNIGIII